MLETLKALSILISALPEIIKLIQALQLKADEAEKEQKIKEDLKKLHEAFNEKNPDKLNAIFNNK